MGQFGPLGEVTVDDGGWHKKIKSPNFRFPEVGIVSQPLNSLQCTVLNV